MYSTTQNQKANLDSIFDARTRGGLRLPGRIETLSLELAKWIWSDEEIAPHRSDKYSADAVAKHDARVAGTQDRLVALLAAALSIVLPGARLLCASYRPGRWAKVAGLEQRVCLGCDRPQAEHADAPDADAQSTTAGVVAKLREERPEPRTVREPILPSPPPTAAPEEGEARAGRPTPKADAEARVWGLYESPRKRADMALVNLARRLGRLPNKDEVRAMMAHIRATASELAAMAGDIDTVKGGGA